MTNHQRVGITSNALAGKNFEIVSKTYLEQTLNTFLSKGFALNLCISNARQPKSHKFDLGNDQFLIECKSHRWTSSGNVPSAKITVWNEAMFYFSLAPREIKKILFVETHHNQKRNKSLAQYYVDTFSHLIPDNVEIWEYDTELGTHKVIQ